MAGREGRRLEFLKTSNKVSRGDSEGSWDEIVRTGRVNKPEGTGTRDTPDEAKHLIVRPNRRKNANAKNKLHNLRGDLPTMDPVGLCQYGLGRAEYDSRVVG